MTGYKRVNYYELCRLCATNHQTDKTHIFQEEGQRRQLQTKIQNCLSLKVSENDYLPKVVCSQCLRSLEKCYTFRKECYSSESMLSSYFKNYQYTEDFEKYGKVYIKDTSPTAEKVPIFQDDATNSNPFSFNPDENGLNDSFQFNEQISSERSHKSDIPSTTTNSVEFNYNVATLKQTTKSILNEISSNLVVNSNSDALTPTVDISALLTQYCHKTEENVSKDTPRGNLEDVSSTLLDPIPCIKPDNSNSVVFSLPPPQPPHAAISSSLNLVSNMISFSNINMSTPPTPHPFPNVEFTPVLNPAPPNFSTNFQQISSIKQQLSTRVNILSNLKLGNVNTYVNGNSKITNIFGQNGARINPAVPAKGAATTTLTKKEPETNKTLETKVADDDGSKQAIKSHVCDVCSKAFKKREHLYQHTKLHSGVRPFKCPNCNKSFLRKEHLFRHIVSHSGQKNYMCDICEKSFSRHDNLLKHKKTHEKHENFYCQICEKKFVSKHFYLAHKQMHNGTKRGQSKRGWNAVKV